MVSDLDMVFSEADMSVTGVSAQNLATKCEGYSFFFVRYGRNPREMELTFEDYFKTTYIPMPRPSETDKELELVLPRRREAVPAE